MREGVPLATVLSTGRRIREHAESLAEIFVRVIQVHAADSPIDKLRPLARAVVDAELSMALDRRLRESDEGGPGAGATPE